MEISEMNCGECGLYEFEYREGKTPEETIKNLLAAQNAARDKHSQWHRDNDTTHIRKQINPRRIQTGNQFYKNRAQLSRAENGSETLCGGKNTTIDMAWADARFAKNMAYVTCDACKAEYKRLKGN